MLHHCKADPPAGLGNSHEGTCPQCKEDAPALERVFCDGCVVTGEEEPTTRESNSSGRKFGYVGNDSPAGEDVN